MKDLQDEALSVMLLRSVFRRIAGDGCWEWTGCRNDLGYGTVRVNNQNVPAHRLMWEFVVGSIPDGLQIDHLCRNPSCVNPAHLEPVTPRENVLRGVGATAMNAAKTHCLRGHEFTPENTAWEKNKRGAGRRCKACKRLLNRQYGKAAA